jgi:hypothetical protein
MRRYARFLSAVAMLVACVAESRPAAAQRVAVTNDDVVRMVAAGLSDDVVVRAIRSATAPRFDTSPDALIALRAQKVSNTVIAAMLEKQAPGAAAPAASQRRAGIQAGSRRKWEIEVHGGGAFGSNPSGGTGSLPPAGPTFTTSTFNPSRRASSWYFGDGAALMNAINASFPGNTAPGRITPLDPVLTQRGATWGNGGGFGFRVSRTITPRFSAEFTLDAALAQLKLTDSLLAGVEASRASFIAAWNDQTGLVKTGGGVVFITPSFSSVAAISDKQGRDIFTTGALRIDFPSRRRFVPYATVGAGVISHTGGAPSVTLTGNYAFQALNNFFVPGQPFSLRFQVNETDNATIRVVPASSHPFVGVFGGGVEVPVSPRWGLRVDARAYVSRNTFDVLVDANPQVAVSTPAGFIASTLSPSMQFSNNPTVTNQQSTLSGAPISGFKTFSGSGTPVQVSIAFGYFVRF